MTDVEQQLMALSPLDGRYAERVDELRPYLSEYGLIRARVAVMGGWLSTLGSGILPDRPPLGDEARQNLDDIHTDFGVTDALEVKEIEKTTNHDVKAVELWLRGKLGDAAYDDYRELIHFGCTSEDVNSTAYGLTLADAEDVLMSQLIEIQTALLENSERWADIPMLAMTHGQPATPTTLGKEMRVFADRLDDRVENITDNVEISAKFSGATGNYAAAHLAYPEVNWPEVARGFVVGRLGLCLTTVTTQIEPHDWMAAFANEYELANSILSDFAKDMWLYISRGVLKQRVIEGEVGSSTMPHKVNPIDFENAEGNFDIANGVLQRLATSLPVSRMQRDLSDSTRLRVWGTALGHSLVGYKSIRRGLGKIDPDVQRLAEELDGNWAVLTEAVQTVMRRYNVPGAYDRIKAASRGQELDSAAYHNLVASLTDELPPEAVERLQALTPATYTGLSAKLASGELW